MDSTARRPASRSPSGLYSCPGLGCSDTWQLVILMTTTLIWWSFSWDVQTRDGRAMQLKLDEAIRWSQGARSGMVRLDVLPDEELYALTGGLRETAAMIHRMRRRSDFQALTTRGSRDQPSCPISG